MPKPPPLPRSGQIIRLTRAASVQFTQPIVATVVRVDPRDTYHGWVWLDVFQLDQDGRAVERRSVFVQLDGIQYLPPPGPPAPRPSKYRRRT